MCFLFFLPSLPGFTHADPYLIQSRQGIIPKSGHPGEFPKRWCGWFHWWSQWIGLLGKIYRKPWFLPWNIGLSCKFSHHPILWWSQSSPKPQWILTHQTIVRSPWLCLREQKKPTKCDNSKQNAFSKCKCIKCISRRIHQPETSAYLVIMSQYLPIPTKHILAMARPWLPRLDLLAVWNAEGSIASLTAAEIKIEGILQCPK